ncbi:hypothetical protein Tco_0833303 [Tanacetum coccineum]
MDNPQRALKKKKKFLMYPRFLMVFLNNQIELGEPFNDVYVTPAHTQKVFSNMSRKGVKFSGKVTPLFDSLGDQPPVTNSSSSHDTTQDYRDFLEGTNGSEGDQVQPSHDSNLSGGPPSDKAKGGMTLEELSVLCTNLSNRVLALEASKDAQAAEIIKLKTRIKKLKKKSHLVISHHKAWLRSVSRLSTNIKLGRKESVSKQGRKNAKLGPTLDDISTARPELSTTRPDVDAARQEDIAVLIYEPSTTTCKSVLEEPEPAKNMNRSDFDAAQIARDVEIARQLQVDLQAEVEREREMEEEASKAAIAETYHEVQAGMGLMQMLLLAAKLQQEEREEYTIKERAKFLAETIAAQRKFRAAQRSAEIRSRPPTKSQLRNLMMTYLKNMGGYKHSQLKAKTFAEIQGLYERQKRVIDDFKPMDSDDAVKDSKEAAGVHKQKVLEEPNSTKVEVKQEGHEESIRKRPGRRLKMKATKKSKRQKTDADLEEEEQLKAFLKIVPDEEGIIDYEVLEKRSDGSSRWIKTFFEMVTRFDRLDLVELYDLVMKKFETTTPEGVDLVFGDDLRTMFNAEMQER